MNGKARPGRVSSRLALALALVLAAAWAIAIPAQATSGAAPKPVSASGAMNPGTMKRTTNTMRRAAAAELARARSNQAGTLSGVVGSSVNAALQGLGLAPAAVAFNPQGVPDYFGTIPNYALSPLPENAAGAFATQTATVKPGTGMRKFVDSLPGLGAAAANDLGQYIPVASANTTMFPGSDYYVIALGQFEVKLHADLAPTRLRGYVQLNPTTLTTITPPSYLGPAIVATSGKAVRVRFINRLPVGTGGDLFLPTDTTLMGAGAGPVAGKNYTQNRATLHLHGGNTPWISDGTPHQWTTPAGEDPTYPKGVSVSYVPDMWFKAGSVVPSTTAGASNNPGAGELTFYYSNQQSARLMFYHDHAIGITRLNVYAGEAAPYLLTDPADQALANGGVIGSTVVAPSTVPTQQVPLVIQDKTFVPRDAQLLAEDPTWDKAKWGTFGDLWFPHVYMPNANPSSPGGATPMGRWDYYAWFSPPLVGVAHGPVPNPLYGQPGQPSLNPGVPNVSVVPEAFMDTPLVNGTAYPYLKVGKKAYRFRILNACDDRMLNLQIYFAKSNTPSADASGNLLHVDSGEVPMVPAAPSTSPTWPSTWPTDGRTGGVPSPSAIGPSWIQIGSEGGFLPSATVVPAQPVDYETFRRTITFGNVTSKSLYLGPAERADVIVDFSQVPDGAKLILYNDAPAPMPAFDSRYDFFTGDGDQTDIGGAPDTLAGYGPNTRTVMQFQVDSSLGSTVTPYDIPKLQTALQAAYRATQDKPIVPEPQYDSVYGKTYPDVTVHATDTTIGFTPADSTGTTVTETFQPRAIIEGFEMDYGRMNAQLGGTLPNLGPTAGAAVPHGYSDPATEEITNTPPGTLIGTAKDGTQIWRIDHGGVDTHAIHFHLFNVQVINRVDVDGGANRPPDPNELGWKETVRMNPGQDVIVALRPLVQTMPFKLGDSIRPANPAVAVGATYMDGNGQPIVNTVRDFGWEYVWHCHLLGHEENDMMRPVVFTVAPSPPKTLTSSVNSAGSAPAVTLKWVNTATNPAATSVTVTRSPNSAFTASVKTVSVAAGATSFVDSTASYGVTYYYRVKAENAAAYSTWSNTLTVTPVVAPPLARTNFHVQGSGPDYIRVAWTNPTGGGVPTGMVAQNSTAGPRGPWSSGTTLALNSNVFTYTKLRTKTAYWMRIVVTNAGGMASTPALYWKTP
jgi:FtsP/CotA-like multicopper oxidase with cupredoxin domain